MSSKNEEIACLRSCIAVGLDACDFGSKSVRRLMRKLSNAEVVEGRPDNARPDFIMLDSNKSQVIGIEHLAVQKYSEENHRGRLSTPFKDVMRDIEAFRKCHVDEVLQSERVSDEILTEWVKFLQVGLDYEFKSSYSTYLKSFRHSLSTHIAKIEDYVMELSTYDAERVELNFLIEVGPQLQGLYLYTKGKGWHQNNNEHMLMFQDIVTLLKSVDSAKVAHIILHMVAVSGTPKVIVLRTCDDIDEQLKRQHVKVFNYVDTLDVVKHKSLSISADSLSRDSEKATFMVTQSLATEAETKEDLELAFAKTIVDSFALLESKQNIAMSYNGRAFVEEFEKIYRWGSNSERVRVGALFFNYMQQVAQENQGESVQANT